MPIARLHAALIAAMLVMVSAATPASANFNAFLNGLWPQAKARGVSERTFRAAFNGMSPDPKVIAQTKKQAEFVKPIWEYLSTAVSDNRIEKGRANYSAYRNVLKVIEQRYGVEGQIVLAVWGMETNYGGYMGKNNAIRALATLTYHGYRSDFFRNELLNALVILERGHTTPDRMEGSWAGAMGHTQFMPSSFMKYAADYEGDGHADIWGNVPDALASTANYLKSFGWRTGETWGYEVDLPNGFNYALADEKTERSLAEWRKLGITRTRGREFPRPDDRAVLVVPAGARGPAFLMLPNFQVIKRYNNSTSYAMGVGHLADRIIGGGPFEKSWPVGEPGMSRKDTEQLQILLSRRGFNTGGADGKAGPMTRAAIRAYQQSAGMPADGFPSHALLKQLKSGS
ncbi:MAG: lytic murein transglycosylase [Rhodobiaceae bacterium]|nr:lytic murein transglycosylase [Rhodobiaceae bacterium]MCC0048227.1 lytic murein transglycosylase [Rhodobiaceae bacterium]